MLTGLKSTTSNIQFNSLNMPFIIYPILTTIIIMTGFLHIDHSKDQVVLILEHTATVWIVSNK